MPAYPKNYPFYNWVPKPIGIIILFMFFLPILTVGGTYSANGTEMMSGLGIISEHIQFANFATSKYTRRGSNPQALRRRILNPMCIPNFTTGAYDYK